MTVKELREILEKLPPDMEVCYSGIDGDEYPFIDSVDLISLCIIENRLFVTGWEDGSISVEDYLQLS